MHTHAVDNKEIQLLPERNPEEWVPLAFHHLEECFQVPDLELQLRSAQNTNIQINSTRFWAVEKEVNALHSCIDLQTANSQYHHHHNLKKPDLYTWGCDNLTWTCGEPVTTT